MRETVAGLKLQIGILEQRLEQRDSERARLFSQLGEQGRLHAAELEKVRTTTKDALRLNHRLATRNDALQWALYMAQMVARSVQEKLDKCEALVKVEGDKLSLAS